jgi:thiol-disulfide isomerase/thioredoxin
LPGPHATLSIVGSEGGLRRLYVDDTVSLRLWHGVASWGPDRVVTADWDAIDVYRIVQASSPSQTDATLSNQRLRFNVAGGTIAIKLRNQGGSPLHVTSITSGAANFSVDPKGPLTLQPDEFVDLAVSYVPGAASQALLLVNSDDPDEAKLPVEMFGDTPYLDPGQAATQFTLPEWRYDHEGDQFVQSTFKLSDQAGKVVYFQVFGTWCPACLPVIADMQNSLGAKYENHPQVVVALMSQKETAAVLQEYWRNIYLRMPILFDLPGTISFIAYAQPISGLPFSRGFLLAPDQTIVDTYFSFNADRVIDAIQRQLAPIAIMGDANLDGYVDGDDFEAIREAWGECSDPTFCPADLNHDGVVDEFDWELVRQYFGQAAG